MSTSQVHQCLMNYLNMRLGNRGLGFVNEVGDEMYAGDLTGLLIKLHYIYIKLSICNILSATITRWGNVHHPQTHLSNCHM